MLFEKGKKLPGFTPQGECAQFGMDESGTSILVRFNNPNNHEIEQFSEGMPFEIRFVEVKGIIMVLIKIGDLNWMDAPYSPHISKGNYPGVFQDEIPDGTGYSLMLILLDSNSGIIKCLRFLGLSTRFSRELRKTSLRELQLAHDKVSYTQHINQIYSQYTTNQLVKLSNIYYKE